MTKLRLSEFRVHNLKPLNLKVNDEIICLSGPSGSGKSLLLRAITDLIEHEGEAYLDENKCSEIKCSEIKCSEINPVQWRTWVGFLPAESAWWMDTVGDHFNQKSDECHEYLTALNLPVDSLKWEVSRCSTGEKQRLAIVRLLQQQPKVLLLDEPTASLDAESVNLVESVIKKYAKEFNVPVIWVSHDQRQIKRVSDRELNIKNNEIKEVTV